METSIRKNILLFNNFWFYTLFGLFVNTACAHSNKFLSLLFNSSDFSLLTRCCTASFTKTFGLSR